MWTQPMSWLFELVSLRAYGTRFRLHPLFTIMLLLSAVTGHFIEIITLFAIVLIHEIGHAVCAKQLGWRVREVRLTPFGGVAVTDEDGSIPAREEALVAAAGPAMNALMIGFAYTMLATGIWTHAWTMYFVQSNATLLLFNLLPVLPLDGGKLLRVTVGYALPYYRTLKTTAYWSILASALMIGIAFARIGEGGLELNLLLIGSFLLYANWYEWRTVPYRFFRFLLGRDRRVEGWIQASVKPHPLLVSGRTRLTEVVRRLKRERLHIVVVMDGPGQVVGVLPEERVTKHYLEKEQNRAVSDLFM